jgi:hypothetical protein
MSRSPSTFLPPQREQMSAYLVIGCEAASATPASEQLLLEFALAIEVDAGVADPTLHAPQRALTGTRTRILSCDLRSDQCPSEGFPARMVTRTGGSQIVVFLSSAFGSRNDVMDMQASPALASEKPRDGTAETVALEYAPTDLFPSGHRGSHVRSQA